MSQNQVVTAHAVLQVGRACSELDALMSLAQAALVGYSSGPMCRPSVTNEHPCGGSERPFFQVKALRNATQIRLSGAGAFVPNDIDLGTSEAPFMLLTGPNTGGKSTLMRQVLARPLPVLLDECCQALDVSVSTSGQLTHSGRSVQVCLATLLSQVGAWLPAEEAALSPADAIFVRMGAKDHIMMGQSTFMVELSETAAMLSTATKCAHLPPATSAGFLPWVVPVHPVRLVIVPGRSDSEGACAVGAHECQRQCVNVNSNGRCGLGTRSLPS